MMEELKSTTIGPIAFYCFFLGCCLLYFAANAILGSNGVLSNNDPALWFPVISFTILAGGAFAVGAGIINLKQLCWKILFFALAICVSSMAALIIAFVIFLLIDVKFLAPYFSSIQTNSVAWLSALAFFLSEIIVLYYLTREEVVSSFGGMGEIVSPF
jgi:hypothetical protein